MHGNLGLVLTEVEYQSVSYTPYERPTHLGQLAFPNGATLYEATRLKSKHKDPIEMFRETEDLEKALRYQITAAVPADHLDTLRNREANAIT